MTKENKSHKSKPRKEEKRKEEKREELEEKVLFVNRCSKVVKGGRKFSFSALILVGDGKGRVGYGFAKANELTDAIRKGGENARKNMHNFTAHSDTIPHETSAIKDGSKVFLRPAPEGTGIIAGSNVRSVLELAGIKDVVAKLMGSNNPINQVKATFDALTGLHDRDETMKMRGQN